MIPVHSIKPHLIPLCEVHTLIDTCCNEDRKLDIIFNASKSLLFKVGKVSEQKFVPLRIGDQMLYWVHNLKYLGLYFVYISKNFQVDIFVGLRKIYSSANAITKQYPN